MGRPRKTDTAEKKPAAKNSEPELVYDEGYWWIVKGTKRLNAGRSERYAQKLMEDTYPK